MARSRQSSHNAPHYGPPQGRLTLVSGAPVMTSDQSGVTTLYYTPYVGDRVPIYNGTEWTSRVFTELSIAMAANAAWAINSNYDVFVINDAGTLRLATGQVWSSDTARDASFGITRLNGLWVNSTNFNARYSTSSTVTVAANCATYVGTVRVSGATGTMYFLFGTNAAGTQYIIFNLWNCYNRVLHIGKASDTTDSWTYNSSTWRRQNDSAGNAAYFVRGLDEEPMQAFLHNVTDSPQGVAGSWAIALDSTTSPSSKASYASNYVNITLSAGDQTLTVSAARGQGTAEYSGRPGLGYHYLQALEASSSASASFYGDAGGSDMLHGFHVSGFF